MADSPDVNRVRFQRFVARALATAHERGLSDKDIAEATGVGASTFHRWKRGDFAKAPEPRKVRQFCKGLGVPVEVAWLALGLVEGRDDPEPEPAIDPDVRQILRQLADPNVSDKDKEIIREMLRMISRRPTTPTK